MGKVLSMHAATILATAGEKLFLASSVTREQQPEGKWTSQPDASYCVFSSIYWTHNELKFHFYLTKAYSTECHTKTIHTK